MSFNTILEAEKEADLRITTAKEKAKQMIADALVKQEKDIKDAKIEGETQLKSDLVDFENKLKVTIETENKKRTEQLTTFVQEARKRKEALVKQIVSSFK